VPQGEVAEEQLPGEAPVGERAQEQAQELERVLALILAASRERPQPNPAWVATLSVHVSAAGPAVAAEARLSSALAELFRLSDCDSEL